MKNTETAKQESTKDYNLENIEPFRPHPRFDTDNRGVWWINVRTDKDGDIIEAEPLLLSDPIDIIGTGQDNDGAYYRIIKFKDKITRRYKTAALPQAEIAGGKCWERLGFYSLFIESNPTKKAKTGRLFAERGSPTAFTITDRAGWHEDSYIMPSGKPSQRPTKTRHYLQRRHQPSKGISAKRRAYRLAAKHSPICSRK